MGIFFLAAPLILVKGWDTVRKPAFLFPLLAAVIAFALNSLFRGMAAFVIPVLAYLHWRYDLSGLGFRSYGWKGDALAVLLLALIYSLPVMMKIGKSEFFWIEGFWRSGPPASEPRIYRGVLVLFRLFVGKGSAQIRQVDRSPANRHPVYLS